MSPRVGVVTDTRRNVGGIPRFAERVTPALLDHPECRPITIDRTTAFFQFSYPLGLDFLKRFVAGRRIVAAIGRGEYERVFLPDHRVLTFDPRGVSCEVLPYVHDVLPVTTAFSTATIDDLPRAAVSRYTVRQLERCSRVVCASEQTRRDLVTRTRFDGEATVVYQGVDDLPVASGTDPEYDLLYVGTTMDRKNPRFLRACFEAATAAGYDCAAVTGSGARLPGTRFENVDDETLADLYAKSRFYLHPSKQEGFGRPPLEAQRQGTPTLALDLPINREVLGPAGESWLPVGGPDDVVAALDDAELDGEAARTNAGQYVWERTARELETLLFED